MTIKAVVFDLDDTLYDELDYIRSGLRIVAEYLTERFNWSLNDLNRQLLQSLEVSRNHVVDRVLTQKGVWSECLMRDCDKVYREHIPNIRLSHHTKRLLKRISKDYALFVVTAGDVEVQKNKLDVLGLSMSSNFEGFYSIDKSASDYHKSLQSSIKSIANLTACRYENMVYISNQYNEDFSIIQELGIITIILQDSTADINLFENIEPADYSAASLEAAISLVSEI